MPPRVQMVKSTDLPYIASIENIKKIDPSFQHVSIIVNAVDKAIGSIGEKAKPSKIIRDLDNHKLASFVDIYKEKHPSFVVDKKTIAVVLENLKIINDKEVTYNSFKGFLEKEQNATKPVKRSHDHDDRTMPDLKPKRRKKEEGETSVAASEADPDFADLYRMIKETRLPETPKAAPQPKGAESESLTRSGTPFKSTFR